MKPVVYQAQHRLLMEIFRNPDASQTILPGRWMCLRQHSGIPEKVGERGYIKRETVKRITGSIKLPLRRKETKLWSKASKFLIWYIKGLEGFSEEEKRTLFTLLQKLNSNLDRMEAETK